MGSAGTSDMRWKVIDLFCGAGGLSEGFRQAGFHVLAGNDINRFAGETFARTHLEAEFFSDPIHNLSSQTLLNAASVGKGELDCLIGGPPCQAYSVYNHQRGLHDPRSRLFREYLRVVEDLMPKWLVMENVTGITSVGNGRPVRDIQASLAGFGYELDIRVLRAEEYGIPQERRRIFFVGNRIGKRFAWPKATHGPGLLPFVTVWDAIGDLCPLENGQDPGRFVPYRTDPKCGYQAELRGNLQEVTNHAAPKLAPINLKRMEHIPQGGSWRDIPVELLPAGMKLARRCDHTKRYGRLAKTGLSCTVLTKCDLHWGSFIHPEQERVLTVREAARLQSFPDWFEFAGPRTEQFIQVGNAVPPLLGRRVAEAILSAKSGVKPFRQEELVFAGSTAIAV